MFLKEENEVELRVIIPSYILVSEICFEIAEKNHMNIALVAVLLLSAFFFY